MDIIFKNKLTHNILYFKIIIFSLIMFTGCIDKSPFQIVLLPDTQIYSERYPEIFKSQTKWIADNADSIAFVLHQGDITNRNTEEQWGNAADALEVLYGKIPVSFVYGNHDIGEKGFAKTRDSELFNKYLPYEKYSQLKEFGGAFESGKMDNTWYTFKAGGFKWLIISLEFGTRNKVLDWAEKVIEQHPTHKVIINTHAYMYSDNTRMSIKRDHLWLPQSYGVGKLTGNNAVNDGEMMWNKLISKYSNIIMVVSGHVLNSGAGRLVSIGKNGNEVYQMLANYQSGVIGSENGDNGFLRIIKIDPQNKKISVTTYSPYINQFNTTSDHQFEFNEVNFNKK